MNTFTEKLRTGIQGSYYGPNWVEVILKETLDGIDAEAAFYQPVGNVHSIASIVSHLVAWRRGLISAMDGDSSWSVDQESSFDSSAYGAQDEEGWVNLKAALENTQRRLVRLLSNQQDSFLQQQVPQRKYSYEYFIEGTIQHDMYHLGQIVLLKKQAVDQLSAVSHQR